MLARGAPDDVLVRAAAANQTAWMARTAEAAGGVVQHEPGVTWMASVAGAVLAFPRISRKRLAELLPRFLEAGRAAGAGEASCWSLVPTTPRDLDDVLQRSGFRTGWEANWMAVEISERRPGLPAGVRVDLAPPDWEPTELPWDGAGIAMVRRRLAASTPRMVVARRCSNRTRARQRVARPPRRCGRLRHGGRSERASSRDRRRAHAGRARSRQIAGMRGRHSERDVRGRAPLPASRVPLRGYSANLVAVDQTPLWWPTRTSRTAVACGQ